MSRAQNQNLEIQNKKSARTKIKTSSPSHNDYLNGSKPEKTKKNTCIKKAYKAIRKSPIKNSKEKLNVKNLVDSGCPESNSSEESVLEEFKFLFIEILADKLEEIASENSRLEKVYPREFIEINQTIFYNSDLPEISIKDYLIRIVSLCKVEVSTCILASIYIDRLCQLAAFYLTWKNVYR